jgi:two-component system, OmpR family, KDP operon response regulator KdpE
VRERRVLIIDDEPAIGRALRPALQGHQFAVSVALTGAEGLGQLAREEPDIVLLDLGLPDTDGLTLLGRIRAQSGAPVIVLSVRGGERDKIAALDQGADDYLTKPFGIGELLARMRVALRHAGDDTGAPPAPAGPVVVGDLTLDPARHVAAMRGAPVHLSPTEWNLLELLARNAGKVVTHRTILHRVWGPEYVGDTQLLRVYVGQLRAKIEARPERPTYILTEPGIGYRFRDSE